MDYQNKSHIMVYVLQGVDYFSVYIQSKNTAVHYLLLLTSAVGQRKQYSQFSIIPVHSSCTTGFINQLETGLI